MSRLTCRARIRRVATSPECPSLLTVIFGRLLDGPGDPSSLARFLFLIGDPGLSTLFEGIMPCALNSSVQRMSKGF